MDPLLTAALAKLKAHPQRDDPAFDHEAFLRSATGGKYGVDDAQAALAAPTLGGVNPRVKAGHPVIDTSMRDNAGHVPTHRLDQQTNRLPNETFPQYEQRVLAKNTWSPDTAARSDLGSLEPEVADSARSLLAHAKAAGVPLGVAETRRTQERQEMLFQKGRTAAQDSGPVTWTLTSDHTPGRALDMKGSPASLAWVQKHAPEHGFSVMGALDMPHIAMQPKPKPLALDVAPPAAEKVDAPQRALSLPAAILALKKHPEQSDANFNDEKFLRDVTGGKYGADDAQAWLEKSKPAGLLSNIGSVMTAAADPKELLNPNSGARNMLRSGVQGAMANFGDEALRHLPKWAGGGDDAADEMQLRDQRFRNEQPASDVIGRVGGAVGAAALAPELKLGTAANIAKGAGIGAGLTAANFAGDADPGQRTQAMADHPIAIGLGGVLGGAIPAAVAGWRGVSRMGSGAGRLKTAVEKSGGLDAMLAKSKEFADAGLGPVTTLGDLSDPLRGAAKYTVQNAEDAVVPAVAKAPASPTLSQAQARTVLSQPPVAATAPAGTPATMSRVLATQVRNRNAPQRMMDKARGLMPEFGADPNAPAAQKGLLARIKAWADGPNGYGGLADNNTSVNNTVFPAPPSPELTEAQATLKNTLAVIGDDYDRNGVVGRHIQAMRDKVDALTPQLTPTEEHFMSIVEQPKVRDALARAKQTGLIGYIPEATDRPSFTKLLQLKKDVSDAAQKAIVAGGGKSQLGHNLAEAADMIDQHIADNVPEYGAVRDKYAAGMRGVRAFDTGTELFQNGDSRNIAAALKGMNAGELHNARMAVASDFIAKLRKPAEAASFSRSIMNSAAEGSSENALQDKMLAMFGTKQRFDEYMQFARLNHELGRMSGAYSGSDTFRNFMAANSDPLPVSATQDAAKSMLSTRPVAALKHSAFNRASIALRRAEAAKMAGPLMAKGQQAIDEQLRALFAPQSPLTGKLSSQALPAMAGGLFDR